MRAFSKTNAQGKVINYANGVSIDTDNVTYIENGPNFHTYTFNLTRENSLPTDPVENLVLIPTTEGAYRELLVSYNLTPQEKQTLMNGGHVDTKGKATITELAKGTYNNGGLTGRSSCGWDYSLGYTICDGNDHHSNGELPSSEGGPCRALHPSVQVLVAVYKCYDINDTNPIGNDWWAGPGGSSGGSGGECTDCPPNEQNPPTEPCNGNGVATGPLDPNAGIGEGGCEGIVTIPTLEFNPTIIPCEILKNNDAIPKLKHKIDSLRTRVTQANPDKHETMVVVTKEEPSGELIYNTYVSATSGTGFIGVSGVGTNNDIADAHNHPPGTIPIYAFGDIVNIYDSYKFLFPNRKNVFVSYLVNFNGTTYALKMNDTTALDALFAGMNIGTATTTKAQKDLAKGEVLKIFNKHGQDEKKTYSQVDAEKLFMNVINDPKIGAGSGIHIYRKDYDGWGKLNMDASGNITKEDCPL